MRARVCAYIPETRPYVPYLPYLKNLMSRGPARCRWRNVIPRNITEVPN
jgi:hypothetical protein